MRTARTENREKFLLAAIEELREHGVADFSVRRVAIDCGVSSGAPYRHFADKNELIFESMRYVNGIWRRQVEPILEGDLTYREKIVTIGMKYVDFLCRHPEYLTILTLSDSGMTERQKREKAMISESITELIDRYCESVGMPEDVKVRKAYVFRSLLIGGAWMLSSGVFESDEKTFSMIRNSISREFDID